MRNRSVGGQRDGIAACGLRDRELAKGQGEGSLEGGDMVSAIRIATMSHSYPRQSVRACNPHKGVTKLQSLWRKQSLQLTIPRKSGV